MTKVSCRCVVAGRVQGVWFRASTRRKAESLGLQGSAVNLPTGQVEVIACGELEAIESLKTWLWQGSPAAEVASVECEWLQHEPEITGFRTG